MLLIKYQIRIQYELMINKGYAKFDSITDHVLNYLEYILIRKLLMLRQVKM